MNKKDITAMAAAATIATGVSVNEMNKAADNKIIPIKKPNVIVEKTYENVSELEPEKKKWLLDTAEKVYTINKDEIVPSDIILAINSGETGWGSSRFWKEGSNNLFNFQSFDDKEESIAAQNSKAKIKKFDTQEEKRWNIRDW
jgi:flagellum-specific peptidoglycan hydrolase FlgJ